MLIMILNSECGYKTKYIKRNCEEIDIDEDKNKYNVDSVNPDGFVKIGIMICVRRGQRLLMSFRKCYTGE